MKRGHVTEASARREGLHLDVRRAAARARAIELFLNRRAPAWAVFPSLIAGGSDEYPHPVLRGMLGSAVIAAALSTDPRLLLADEANRRHRT